MLCTHILELRAYLILKNPVVLIKLNAHLVLSLNSCVTVNKLHNLPEALFSIIPLE